jgi:hypothetical protein
VAEVETGLDATTVELYPLRYGAEVDGEHEVGRADSGVFVALPPEGVVVLRWLGEGVPVGEVRRRFQQRYGTDLAVAEFLDQLVECDFVRAVGGRPVTPAQPAGPPPRGLRLFEDLPQRRVEWLTSRPVAVLAAAVWLAVPLLLAVHPWLVPRPADAWTSGAPTVNVLLAGVVAMATVALHELSHLLVARARGCVGTLSLSRRLFFLVAQTEMTGVRALPRRQRYAPLLAGMTWDLIVLLAMLVLRLAGAGGRVAPLVAYLLTLSLVYQCAVFMRTDLYFVLTNALRTGNLAEDTRHWLANQLARLRGRPARHDLSAVPARELRIIARYAPFYLLGVVTTTVTMLALVLPVTVRATTVALTAVTTRPNAGAVVDGLVFLALTAANVALLGWVTIRDARQNRRLQR